MHVISRFGRLMGMLGLAGAGALACGSGQSDNDSLQTSAITLATCGLDDGTVDHHADVRACTPDQTHKTTICHIPPGNPANAHTLCIGTPGVAAHLKNHGDYLGPCKIEAPCPPPSGTGGMGGSPANPPDSPPASGGAGMGGMSGAGGMGGGGAAGAAGSGGQTADPIIVY